MPTAQYLHLVDFHQVDLDKLKTQITDALENGQAFLAMLDDEPNAKDNQQALNDIIAFDHVNLALDRNWGLLSHLNSVVSRDEIRALHHELLPQISAYGTQVGQHVPLFSRYQQLAKDDSFFATLEPARQRAITLALQSFELSGVGLPSDKKLAFGKLSSELSTLSAKFSDNVLDATQSCFLPLTQAQLAGLPETALAMLADAGKDRKSTRLNSSHSRASRMPSSA